MKFPSYEEQATHCRQVAQEITQQLLPKYLDQGLDCPEKGPALREKLYFALTFLCSGQKEAVDYANRIIQKAPYGPCSFSPMIALQMVIKYRHLLEEKSVQTIRDYISWEIESEAKPDMAYVGVNDNFPSMAACALILGGQFLDRPELCQLGKERLGQFVSLFTRRGVASEYTSPTYSPIQLLAMSEIAHLANDPEARQMARDCETRIWADLLGHMHPATGQMAGPYSRAYTDDSMSHISLMRCTLYAVYGDQLPVNIRNTMLEPRESNINVHSSIDFTANNLVWLMDTKYDCPEEVFRLGLEKTLPCTFRATTEFSSSTDAFTAFQPRDPYTEEETYEYAAGNGSVCTYMTEDYALGTANCEFHNGIQTDAFHLLYRRSREVKGQKDIRTVFSRYLVNEQEPHPEEALLVDQGRKLCFQKDNAAMVLYKPKVAWRTNVESLKLSLILPVQYGLPEEVWLGDRRLPDCQGESEAPCSVFIKDGPVYLAFHPLILTDYGRKAAVRVQVQNGYLVISFYNYEGPARDFATRGYLITGNGFAAEVRSQEECGSFEAFREKAAQFTVTDQLQISVHSRQTYIRHTEYRREGCELACEYSPVSEGVKFISVNGEALEPKKLEITGFPVETLPFCAPSK